MNFFTEPKTLISSTVSSHTLAINRRIAIAKIRRQREWILAEIEAIEEYPKGWKNPDLLIRGLKTRLKQLSHHYAKI